MGAIVRPIDARDVKETYGKVSYMFMGNTPDSLATVESSAIFGVKQGVRSELQETDIYNRRGYISLAIPVVNFFLTGEDADILCGLLTPLATDIVNGSYIYDKRQGRQILLNECKCIKYSEDIQIGGNYLKYLINNLEVEKEIEKLVGDIVYKQIPRPLKKEVEGKDYKDYGSITKGQGSIWVLDEYYFNPNVEELGKDKQFCEAVEEAGALVLAPYSSRLTMLLSIRKSKDNVSNLILDNLIVLPIGYRPTVDKRRDPLTKAYNRIIKCNRDLSNTLSYANADVESVRLKYAELVKEVKSLLKKNQNVYDKNFKPLSEILKGKTGIIRDKMQGVRADYSGRAVITVDPDMSIDTVGLPRVMAETLYQLKLIKMYKSEFTNKSEFFLDKNKFKRLKLLEKAVEGEYIGVGRQPTLFYLCARGFKVVLVEGSAMKLNPLSTTAFNADFDGDQMWQIAPVGDKARTELRTIMGSMNNLFYPRNGECHVAPRQEILYGLWKACNTDRPYESNCIIVGASREMQLQFVEDIIAQRVNVYDTVVVNGIEMKAGTYAVKICLSPNYSKYKLGVSPLTIEGEDDIGHLSETFFKDLFKVIILEDVGEFIKIVNRLVRLGFAIANIFPANISVLNAPSVEGFKKAFEEKVRERQELFDLGFETVKSFTAFYDKEYANLSDHIAGSILSQLDCENGFAELVKSKARGSKSNLVQLFGMKGRVMKSDDEAFNAIIKCPLINQLTGLEHSITAYGSRKGLVDKTIKTYAPGYLTRKMEHTAAPTVIRAKDCGTKDGLHITFDSVQSVMQQSTFTGDDIADNRTIRNYVAKMIVGRFIVGIDHQIPNIEEAGHIYDTYIAKEVGGQLAKLEGLLLRSPLTCEDPCCQKCYGVDLCSNKEAAVGLPIGFIAAQSIGEPGTQLTMKNFQSGGVVGEANLTSSFDTMTDYLHIYDLNKGSASQPIYYDFVAPCAGEIVTIARGGKLKELKIMGYNQKGERVNKLRTTITLFAGAELKKYVGKGESILVTQGDMSIRELLANKSAEDARRYLTLKLFSIFEREVDVDLKHFETLVSSMTFYMCTKGNGYFKTGCYYTNIEYWNNDHVGCKFKKTIKGIAEVPFYRNDVFSTIFMQDIGKGISRSIITSGYDKLDNPLVRTSFGLNPGTGSDIPGYIEKRGGKFV